MNRSMKHWIGMLVWASLLVWTSCSSDEFVYPEKNAANGTYQAPQTITAIAPGADTRVSYIEEDGGTISVKWKQGDEIEVIQEGFPWSDQYYRYTGEEETASAEFEWYKGYSTDESKLGGKRHYGLHKVHSVEIVNYWYKVQTPGSSTPYEQIGDNTLDHLADYNTMVAITTADENGNLREPLQFHAWMAMLSLRITIPAGKAPRQVRLMADSKILPAMDVYGFDTNKQVESGCQSTDCIRLNISGVLSNVFTANLLIASRDLSGEEITVAVECSDGDVFVSQPIHGTNFEKGKRYIKEVTVNNPETGELSGQIIGYWGMTGIADAEDYYPDEKLEDIMIFFADGRGEHWELLDGSWSHAEEFDFTWELIGETLLHLIYVYDGDWYWNVPILTDTDLRLEDTEDSRYWEDYKRLDSLPFER